MKPKNLITVLYEYTYPRNKKSNAYSESHSYFFRKHRLKDIYLKTFLSATMDEVRLNSASEYIRQLLITFDAEDLNFFRFGVLRREITNNIAYNKQRDHSAHTLYNYLLGWFIYEKNNLVKNQFHIAFKKRKLNSDSDTFGNYWPYVSILHDIGYVFEGYIDILSTDFQSKQVIIGKNVLNEYFDHHLWYMCNMESMEERSKLLKSIKYNGNIPHIKKNTMSGIADELRNLTKYPNLSNELIDDSLFNFNVNLSTDIFNLWYSHYKCYGSKSMANRIKYLRNYFDKLIIEGMNKSGIRILDHGVCSGLILIQATTFFYNIVCSYNNRIKRAKQRGKNKKPLKDWEDELFKEFLEE